MDWSSTTRPKAKLPNEPNPCLPPPHNLPGIHQRASLCRVKWTTCIIHQLQLSDPNQGVQGQCRTYSSEWACQNPRAVWAHFGYHTLRRLLWCFHFLQWRPSTEMTLCTRAIWDLVATDEPGIWRLQRAIRSHPGIHGASPCSTCKQRSANRNPATLPCPATWKSKEWVSSCSLHVVRLHNPQSWALRSLSDSKIDLSPRPINTGAPSTKNQEWQVGKLVERNLIHAAGVQESNCINWST